MYQLLDTVFVIRVSDQQGHLLWEEQVGRDDAAKKIAPYPKDFKVELKELYQGRCIARWTK